LTAVVAATPAGVIGKDGDMPWHLRQDLQRFKRLTMGGVLLMGRKTYESIGRPLPGRRTVVMTRQSDWQADGVERAASTEIALAKCGDQPSFVVGGATIYEALLPHCQRLMLTRVWSSVRGDVALDSDFSEFRVVEQSRIPAGLADDVPTEFLVLERNAVRKNL
jgi:dihydrofolate reductase